MPAAGLLERIRNYALPQGSFACRGTWLRQEGEMRLAPERPWIRFTAEQWFPSDSMDFRWHAWFHVAPFLPARVIDSFQGGEGFLSARLFGCIPVARSSGPATDQGEALRSLAELPWRPFAFVEAGPIAWEESTRDSLRATFNGGRTQAAVVFEVDREGRVLSAAAASRPRILGKSVIPTAWSGKFGEYRTFDGIRVPASAEAAWLLPEGPSPYWRGRVTEFRVLLGGTR